MLSLLLKEQSNLKIFLWEFPGGLVIRILGFHCHCLGSIPDEELRSYKLLSERKRKKKKPSKSSEKRDERFFLFVLSFSWGLLGLYRAKQEKAEEIGRR